MKDKYDLTGKTFGKLNVIGPGKDVISKSGKIRKVWICECACGKTKRVLRHNLMSGNSSTCGCERNGRRYISIKKIPEYKVWDNMIQRCTNPNKDGYEYYGGKGIEICKEWRESFVKFYEDMGPRPTGMWIERIDGDGNYESENCCWATPTQQRANQKRNTYNIPLCK